MKLEVDWTRCDGHGLCAQLLASHIATDEWGYPVLGGQPIRAVDEVDARRAVALCPSLALRLADNRSVT